METNQTKPQIPDKVLRRMEGGREYRSMVMEVRAAENEADMIVEGYATTFNQTYPLYEGRYYRVLEQVAPDAFQDCDMGDVILQYDHEGRVFARTRNGTLELSVDGVGLKIRANLAGTDIGRQLYQEIKGGYTDRMSFCFVVGEERREEVENHDQEQTTVIRTITKITKLYDVSAVSIPANDATSISARRYADGVIDGIKAERLERDKKKLRLLLEVM